MSISANIISFFASRISKLSSIVRCLFSKESAFCWNCCGLISSAPILLGIIRDLPETSLNLLANICVLMIYLSITSVWLFVLKDSYILAGSISCEVLNSNPFSSNDNSITPMLFCSANPAKK